MNYQITTWNVNGLRAVLSKGGADWIRKIPPDVLCLQEIKTRPDQLEAPKLQIFEGYQKIWNPAIRPGYSGVATLSQIPSQSYQIGLEDPRFNDEGRVIVTRHHEILLFNVYFPNGKRDYGRLDYKLDFYAHLLKEIDTLLEAGKKVVICGDFNTAHQKIDLRNPKANEKTSGFLPEERAWIDRYLDHGLVDAFRALYPDRVQYTWWTYRQGARERNVGWRLDFFMVSQNLMPLVRDVIVHEDIPFSDHCPVSLILNL